MSVVTFADGGGDVIRFLEVDGCRYPYVEGIGQADAIRASFNTKARQDDIILCNYPKSGTHWIWEVISMILQGSATTIPQIKQNFMIEAIPADQLESIPSPRVLNTHFRFSQLPHEVIKNKCKIVLTLRNPKDVAVSLYNHHKNLVNLYKYNGKWENYMPLFYSGKVDYGCFFDYVLDWEKIIQENPGHPIHVIYYEEMKANSSFEVRRLAEFLGVDISDDVIDAVADKCSFQNMIKDKKGFENELWTKMWRDEKPQFYRKGEVGDWKNWFTVAENEEFDRIYAKRMANSKLRFKFSLS